MLLWLYTFVLAASFAAPFYVTWRTLGAQKVTKAEARTYSLWIFAIAFVLIGIANLAYLYQQGQPNFGATG